MSSFGNVSVETVNAVAQMRERANILLREMGKMDFQKTQLISEISDLENRTNNLLKMEATRLEIPEGTPWSLTPDGEAIPLED